MSNATSIQVWKTTSKMVERLAGHFSKKTGKTITKCSYTHDLIEKDFKKHGLSLDEPHSNGVSNHKPELSEAQPENSEITKVA